MWSSWHKRISSSELMRWLYPNQKLVHLFMMESWSTRLTENLTYRNFCCSWPSQWSINTASHAQFEGQRIYRQGLNGQPPSLNGRRRWQLCQRGSHTRCDPRLQGTWSIHQTQTSFTSTRSLSHPEHHSCATGPGRDIPYWEGSDWSQSCWWTWEVDWPVRYMGRSYWEDQVAHGYSEPSCRSVCNIRFACPWLTWIPFSTQSNGTDGV